MYHVFKKILFCFSAETAHQIVFFVANFFELYPKLLRKLGFSKFDKKVQASKVWGLDFPNPIGLAAGFDKNAKIPHTLASLGFGFLEFGTITPIAQVGNPKPRLFRSVKDKAIFNRMGFNNLGMDELAKNLKKIDRVKMDGSLIGINIGKNKDTTEENSISDYVKLAKHLADYGDYFVLNISSPNTPGLRDLQNENFLTEVFHKVREVLKKPLLVKLAPDLSEEAFVSLVSCIDRIGYDGIVLCNTTIDKDYGLWAKDLGAGGLSGRGLRLRSRELLLLARMHTKMPIISVGGVDSLDEVLWRLEHGANLVQVYSELIFSGPIWVKEMLTDLATVKTRGK